MIIVQRHHIKGNKEIIDICKKSKCLYNHTLYLMRSSYFNKQKAPTLAELHHLLKNTVQYKEIGHSKVSNQILKKVRTDWNNFEKGLREYFKNKKKYNNQPKPPYYKKKLAQVIYYNQSIKGGLSKKKLKKFEPVNKLFSIPNLVGNYKQILITPKSFGFIIDVQYEVKEKKKNVKKENNCTIDLGLNNLCAITLDQIRPILINGRILKSINQYYNKYPNKRNLEKRYFRVENYLHQSSRFIIDMCLERKIGQIIIGKNVGWKKKLKMIRKTKQNFMFIPYNNLIEKIKYKAKLVGIEVVVTEESYTSQSSYFDNDPLPVYGDKNIPKFSGKRIKRGLYVTKDGFAVNADVNGSLNIGRKIISKFKRIGDRSLGARPVLVNPLKSRSLKDLGVL